MVVLLVSELCFPLFLVEVADYSVYSLIVVGYIKILALPLHIIGYNNRHLFLILDLLLIIVLFVLPLFALAVYIFLVLTVVMMLAFENHYI